MASSSRLRNVPGDEFNICPCWFKTIIFPDKNDIYVCPNFQKTYATELADNGGSRSWIINGKAKTVVTFKYVNGTRVLTSGINVAQDNGFEEPTGVILYYEGKRNNFSMLVESLFPPPNMGRIKRYADGLIWNPDTYFKTTVFPNKGKIEIGSDFLNNFKNKLNYELPAWLIDANGRKAEAVFKATKGIWFMKPKVGLDKVFGFTEPMSVYLYFRFQKNEFMMFDKKFHKIFKYGERRAIEHIPIILSSDEEKDEAKSDVDQMDEANLDEVDELHEAEVEQPDDIDPTQFAQFEIKITKSLATSNQVLHFPNETSRYVLKKRQKTIMLRDVATRRITKCQITTADRNEFEKYITKGFKEYKIEKGLRTGDILGCQIEDPPRFMNVEVNRN